MAGAAYFLRRRPSYESNFGGFSPLERRDTACSSDKLFAKAPLGHFTRKTVISLRHPRRNQTDIYNKAFFFYLFIILFFLHYIKESILCTCILYNAIHTRNNFYHKGDFLTHDPLSTATTISSAFTFWLI